VPRGVDRANLGDLLLARRPVRWTIGDYRFSIVEFEPAPDVPLYVQLWSEPKELC
jgi:hypothetical protein